jgi:hypothetical protein
VPIQDTLCYPSIREISHRSRQLVLPGNPPELTNCLRTRRLLKKITEPVGLKAFERSSSSLFVLGQPCCLNMPSSFRIYFGMPTRPAGRCCAIAVVTGSPNRSVKDAWQGVLDDDHKRILIELRGSNLPQGQRHEVRAKQRGTFKYTDRSGLTLHRQAVGSFRKSELKPEAT